MSSSTLRSILPLGDAETTQRFTLLIVVSLSSILRCKYADLPERLPLDLPWKSCYYFFIKQRDFKKIKEKGMYV